MIAEAGITNRSEYFYIQEDAGATNPGEPVTGLTFASLTSASYMRTQAVRVAITPATQTVAGAHTDGGFVEVDATNMPGTYRFDVPDAAYATGADKVVVQIVPGAARVCNPIAVDITEVNLRDAVRGGMGALPNAAAEAAGGLYTRGTGAGQINQNADGQVDVRVMAMIGSVINAAVIATDAIGSDELSAAGLADIGTAVWAAAARTLTANTNLNDPTAAAIRAEIDTNSTQLAAIVAAVITNAVGVDIAADIIAARAIIDIINTATAGLGGATMRGTDGASTHTAADVWAAATRVLTANTNLNDPTAAAIRAEMDANSTQLALILADMLAYVRLMTRSDGGPDTDDAAQLTAINANDGAGAGDFDPEIDSIEAIRDRGDAAWPTAAGFSTHSAADVWAAVTRTLTANTNLNDPTVAAIVAGVWDELTATGRTVGSIGQLILDNINAIMSDIEDDTQNIQSRLPAALVGGRIDSIPGAMAAGVILAATFAAGAVDAAALATDAVAEIANGYLDLAAAIDGLTPRQVQAVMLASVAGELSGAATTTVVITDPAGVDTRITATVDADGNRSLIVLGLAGI